MFFSLLRHAQTSSSSTKSAPAPLSRPQKHAQNTNSLVRCLFFSHQHQKTNVHCKEFFGSLSEACHCYGSALGPTRKEVRCASRRNQGLCCWWKKREEWQFKQVTNNNMTSACHARGDESNTWCRRTGKHHNKEHTYVRTVSERRCLWFGVATKSKREKRKTRS